MAQKRYHFVLGLAGVAVVALAAWVADAEKRADWPSAARDLARAIDAANALDARRQRLAAAKLVGEYATAARWAEQERYAAAEGMAEPLVEVGDFRVTAYLVPRDGGPMDVAGNALHHGVVATDPAVIPTGALIYIPALREFDYLFAPVHRISLRELRDRKEKAETAAATVGAIDGGAAIDDEMGGGVEDGCVVSYEARGGGWWLAKDTGAKVKGRVVDVACFNADAYGYVAKNFGGKTVKAYRMRYANEWTRTEDGKDD